jgi:glycosyltransferase involved in cell wall biosynthesis
MSAPRLSVVVPAYNEAAGIADTLRAVLAALERAGIDDHEVLVVDNASTDGTPAAVEALADPRVRLLRNARNLGKGASMRRGMLEARGELRLHCDADCGPSLIALPRLLEGLEHADVIVGSRLAPGADVGRRQPLGRRIAGRTFVDLCRLLLREPTRDLFCGFKLWRADAAEAAYRASRLDGWVFDAETLAIARALGYRIAEVGVPWNDRAGSRLSMPRVIVPVTLELLAARRRVRAIAADAAAGPLVEPRVAKAAEPHG